MTRIPVTQEYLADVLAAQARKESVGHPALNHFSECLYEGIYKMVHKISHKYKTTIIEAESELSQDCLELLWQKLGKYDSRRGKFSTFAHWVCTNHLKSYYDERKRCREHFVSVHDDAENQEGSDQLCSWNRHMHISDSMLSEEMAIAVRELISKYPNKADLTIGILGSPEDFDNRRFKDEIKLSSVLGYKRREKEKFFHKTIVPFFRKRFGGLYV